MPVIIVERKKLTLLERTYIPQIIGGLWITLKNLFKRKVTLQYPEQRPVLTNRYRGEPTLIKDPDGREKCVSCQLCEFVCPPKAIKIVPGEISADSENAFIEKAPAEFKINMLRCIFCGLCQEVCPERAIVLQKNFTVCGYDRASMINNKETLYKKGGVKTDDVMKWKKVEETGKADKGWH
jgi:NADH-quinone oxidoreductase, chain I